MARTVEFDQHNAIEKALDVFWKKGYNGASMRDLTDAMQINSSSLYNTIGDKHQLFTECIKHYTQKRRIFLEQRAAGAASAVKALEQFFNDVAAVVIKDAHGCFAIKTAFEVSPNDHGIQGLLKEDNDFTHTFLCTLIKKAIKDGEMTDANDADMLADYIISTYTGWYELFLLYRNPIQIKKLADFMAKQLLK
ncbi:TetR/AcrR family transcriptional regulator [Dyadobacter sp. CY326]|uniref:TetR/AcrR family transcriptional regulator n=1 Tax=Dyadobacter sp. CY326 TaxID=2907300 RepID=UPI001F405E35|nr:TetR/AcrR family transcriptional regulator [Dyadobacter sp. CY326]MCE7064057.1 TetR/AcrR family transcriptional regulator [Dyadobacter sp. CY326]